MGNSRSKQFVILSVFICAVTVAAGQGKMPDEFTNSTIEEQFRYVESHTRIYEGFRAIREDIFQKVNGNFLDTLATEKSRVAELKLLTSALNGKTDSLNNLLATTRGSLAEVTATKNKISVLGLGLNKGTYNAIMWILIGGLLIVMAVGFLIFKRNLVVLMRTEKDLKELKEEFAAYRQSSRIAREKVEMDLFRANQKLKGM
ncbi:hypothetical protein EG832_02545 [bacterium]|jgi:hypothetical protein|nr:hypothetical protein [bacterium]